MTIITRDEEGDQERYIIKCSKRREGVWAKKALRVSEAANLTRTAVVGQFFRWGEACGCN